MNQITEQLAAIKRVLELVDGYASTENQYALLAWQGGAMTRRELRAHMKAALKLPIMRAIVTPDEVKP